MKSASRKPRLPGMPRSDSELEAERDGEAELPWEDDGGTPSSGNAKTFAQREREAVAALGKQQEIQSTLRGAPDTIKLGAQTWKPPTAEVDTVKLVNQTWTPTEEDYDDEVTEVDENERRGGALVSETTPEVAGEIRSDDGPAQIVDSPPGDPAVPGPIPESVTVSPSVAVEIHEATTTPIPKFHSAPSGAAVPLSDEHRETRPIPRRPASPQSPPPRPSTPLPADSTPIAEAVPLGPPMGAGDRTTLLDTGRRRGGSGKLLAVAAISITLGLAVGFFLFANNDDEASTSAGASEPPADPKPATDPVAPEPETRPAAAETTTCKLAVRSEPAGAEVRIGGEVVGTTPVDLERACGEVSVTIGKTKYQTLDRKLTLDAASIGVVSVPLERPLYKVTIDSRPKGADVAVNGESRGKTPVTVELPGFEKAAIELTRRGYRPYKKRITPVKKRTRIRPRLKRR